MISRSTRLVLAFMTFVAMSGACTRATEPTPAQTKADDVRKGALVVKKAPEVSPTFECVGIAAPYTGDENANATCVPQYRKKGSDTWRVGHPLVDPRRDGQFRGSIVELEPGAQYEIKLVYEDPDGVSVQGDKTITVRTWSEKFPIARTIRIKKGFSGETRTNWTREGVSKDVLIVEQSGSPDGYILYAPDPGKEATIDVEGKRDHCVIVVPGTKYVIIRGFTLKGAATHAVNIRGSHHVVIERCRITGWGRPGGTEIDDMDAAIYARQRQLPITNLVIQDNTIYLPRSSSNPWEKRANPSFGPTKGGYHPMGPQGVTLVQTDGHHVIRYNSITSDDEHWYNDGIGGGWNNSKGNLYRDSDIYGNLISHCHDDAIESEGANANVRIWSNRLVHNFTGIAVAPVHHGPTYVWGNLITDFRSTAFKLGSIMRREKDGCGALFLYHNTVFSKTRAAGIAGAGGRHRNTTSRNNILAVSSVCVYQKKDKPGPRPWNSYDYDLLSSRIQNSPEMREQERNAVRAKPAAVFTALEAWNCLLKSGSPAIDRGVRIAGFNDNYRGKAPDIGAFEMGDKLPHYGPRPVD